MIQAIVKKGKVFPERVPLPAYTEDSVLVGVSFSCVSAGTELSTLESSKTSLMKRAVGQPGRVREVLHKMRSEGVLRTLDKIRGKLNEGSTFGYSLSGTVLAAGRGITDLRIGDRVACAGAGIACHAEYVDVPRNLIVKIPEGLADEEASTVALGAIAMQGVRRADLKLGEYVVVFGLGVIGQLILQLARHSGCRVIGIDREERRLGIAKEKGAELVLPSVEPNLIKDVIHFSDGFGADKVIFTAATPSSDPLHQAFQMTRKKGKVVLVGVSGMDIKREDLYSKELDFLISTSYGPGRYEETYERQGLDYPYAYVRWTENRNMQEYLKEVAEGSINLNHLIEGIYPIERVGEAFEALQKPDRPLTVLLKYAPEVPEGIETLARKESKRFSSPAIQKKAGLVQVAIVGPGGFATSVHLPNLAKLKDKFGIYAVLSKTPYKAKTIAEQYRARYATCQMDDILEDEKVDLVMILTRHHLHGEYVLKALNAGKHVFVEKPLCTRQEELDRIKRFYDSQMTAPGSRRPLLMVGFNRRFSKFAEEAQKHTQQRLNPLFIHYRVNAGYLPLDQWVHGKEGGGRIIGEACHFIDFFTFLTQCKVKEIFSSALVPKTQGWSSEDNRVIVVNYEDGSMATLEYFATGSKEFPKEYVEIHFDGKTIVIDDYKSIKGYGVTLNDIRVTRPDKGHLKEMEVLYDVLQGQSKRWPIELWDLLQTTEVTFAVDQGNGSCAE